MTEELEEKSKVELAGPGAILKHAREKMGLSVNDIADKLHLKKVNIEAIEADQYDPAISMTFTKGYLKLYAKQVNVPEEAVLAAFAQQNVEEKEPAKLQSFSKRVAKQANDDRLMLLTYLIIAVLLAMVVIWWFQQDSETTTLVDPTATAQPTQADVAQTAQLAGSTPDDLVISAQREAEQAQVMAESETFIDEGTRNETLTDPIEPVQQASQEEASLEESVVGEIALDQVQTIELVFEFAGDCWINITDATGEAIAYGVKKAGRVMPVSGQTPFEVTLGAPEVVQIRYDGVLVDMSRFPAGKSAKFTLPFSI